jgi:potassium uptake TrkH family protein
MILKPQRADALEDVNLSEGYRYAQNIISKFAEKKPEMLRIVFSRKKGERFKRLSKWIARIPFMVSLVSITVIIYDLGFYHQNDYYSIFSYIYNATVITGALSIVVRYFFHNSRPGIKIIPIDLALLILFTAVLISNYLTSPIWLYFAVGSVFTREIFSLKFEFQRVLLNPAQLFVSSFIFLIFLGTLLLMLPKATENNISLIDALFTSASAVCVTGLVVVDTGTYFTEFGQIIILLLIQSGGLGIMTFASYFSYFFKGSTSYRNQMALKDITNAEKLSEVYSVMRSVIFVTLLIELLGALIIFYCLDPIIIPGLNERLFFSVFHAVSGFCNAGFSTLSNSFYELPFRFNYPLHITVSLLFILGGLGFPVVKNLIGGVWRYKKLRSARVLNVNTRVVILTTCILIFFSSAFFFIAEYDNSLAEHSLAGKIATSFFSATSTRTAGFNVVNTAGLQLHTLLMFLILMWIGASPASTGGGIKTSTFAIALLNTISIARGKNRLELYNREIPSSTIERAFSIIFLSFMVICSTVILLALLENGKSLMALLFESISAFGTVGLSMGITAELSTGGKLVLVFTMLAGRVGMLNILIAVFKKVDTNIYRLPSENILIN